MPVLSQLASTIRISLPTHSPEGEKGIGYLIGSLSASRAVSRIARIRHSAAPLRTLSPCAQAPMQLPTRIEYSVCGLFLVV